MVQDRRWGARRLDTIATRHAAGQPIDRIVGEFTRRITDSCAEAARRAALPLTLTYPPDLPVSQRRDEILATLREHRVVVLTGATGSGKTTQLPKMLIEAGHGRRGMIALTQPRRVAAVAMAARIGEELQAAPGMVAHAVRFDDRSSPDTVIRVMTDGLLLAEAATDPDLSRYEAIIIDEAHERSLNIDLLLGLLHRLRARRPELAIVIASASIAAERFAGYFAGETGEIPSGRPEVPVISVEGRMYPVDIIYRSPSDDDVGYLDAALNAILEIHTGQTGRPDDRTTGRPDVPETGRPDDGDILCFLPTERDILEAARRLKDVRGIAPTPLFGRLTPHEQQKVFAPPPAGQRKVVLSTNIAETSLTITGIRYVVDTGLARLKRYQAGTRTERLPIEAISQASALQRAGRAGRVGPGICIRLYDEADFSAREAYTPPEILRSNLAGVLLTCLGMGLGEPEAFPWLDAPAPNAWVQARALLDELGAVEDRPEGGHRLTPLGRTLADIPADPQVARILVAGLVEGVPHEACTIAAFLSVQDPRVRPLGQEAKADAAQRPLQHEAGDLATVLRLWDRWEAAGSGSKRAKLCESLFLGFRRMREWADVRHQLWSSIREGRGQGPLPATGHEAEHWPLDRVHRAVLAGMLGNVLMWDKAQGTWRAAGDRVLALHPGSALATKKSEPKDDRTTGRPDDRTPRQRPLWLVACEVVETSRLFARLCAPIDPQWVVALVGERIRRRHRDPHWHAQRQQVVVSETLLWKGLPVRDGRLVLYERIDPAAATEVFIREGLCGDEPVRLDVVEANARVFTVAARLRHRLRDPALFVEREHLEALYRQRLSLGNAERGTRNAEQTNAIPLASRDALRHWLADHGGPTALALTLADFTSPAAAERAERGAPESVVMGGRTLGLTYRFIPGDESDGVTLELAEDDVAALDGSRLDWLVPAWWPETVEAYLSQLPKDDRRKLIPLAKTAADLATRLAPGSGKRPLHHVLAGLLAEVHGVRGNFDPSAIAPHLRLRYHLVDRQKRTVYVGREPAFLAAPGGGDRLRLLRAEWETAPARVWPGDCVGPVEGLGITGCVALGRARDAQGRVAIRRVVYASAAAAAAWHEDALDAASEAALTETLDRLALAGANPAMTGRCTAHLGAPVGALRRQLALAAAAEVNRGRITDAVAFAAWSGQVMAAVTTATPLIDPLLDQIGPRVEALRKRLKSGARTLHAAQAARTVTLSLERLIAPGWTTRLPWSSTRRLPLFLDACAARLDGKGGPKVEERISSLHVLWDEVIPGAMRLVAACGLTQTVRELAAALAECSYALGTAAGNTVAGQAELRLRTGLERIERTLGDANARLAEARQRLLEVRPLLHRIPVKERREPLAKELDQALAVFPDLSLGADLAGQCAAAQELVTRIRAHV